MSNVVDFRTKKIHQLEAQGHDPEHLDLWLRVFQSLEGKRIIAKDLTLREQFLIMEALKSTLDVCIEKGYIQ